jgi:hypothetical protein
MDLFQFFYSSLYPMNLKKILLGSLAVVVAAVSLANVPTKAAINDAEFTAALSWAYENGLTKYNTEDAFMPYANITREQAAKFMASYTVTNLCDVEAEENEACSFSDINSGDYTLRDYVLLACELGLVRGTGGKFLPTNNLTRAEAFTILSRAMSANASEDAPAEDTTPWYLGHFQAMQTAGITKETDVSAQERSITRYELLLVLYRARMSDAECADTDISDLLEDLFGDDTTTDDDDDDDVPSDSNGTARAVLSPATPNGETVPGGVSLPVASFNFTATTEAVVLDSLTFARVGLGSNEAISRLSIFVDGQVVTKPRSFNSDFRAEFNTFTSPVVIPAGSTVKIDVYGKVGTVADASNQEFAIQLVDFTTNGGEDKVTLPLTANTFRVGGVDGATVVVLQDGSVSDVSLGETAVEVAKFQLDNDADEDVEITQITIKDDERSADNFTNYQLRHDGQTIATVAASADRRTVTFMLATPLKITKNQSEDLRVVADVVQGAGDNSNFVIDQETYVQGRGLQYGYGLAIDVTAFDTLPAASDFIILAGDVTLSENQLTARKIRENQEDVVLADFDLVVNAGDDLTLENIRFDVAITAGGDFGGGLTFEDLFEDVQLEVWVDGTRKTFDLNAVGADLNSVTYSDTQMSISIPATADIQVRLVADTLSDLDATDILGRRIEVTMGTSTGAGFEMIENGEDETVDDITPSVLTFNSIDLVDSSFDVTRLNRGPVSVVRGSKDIDAIAFQVKADDVSDLYIQDITVEGSADFANTHISQVKLWNWVDGAWVLVATEGGTKITSNSLVFDSFNEIKVMMGETMQFLVTVDIVNDVTNVGDTVSVLIPAGGVTANDDNNRALTSQPGSDTAVGRVITITNAGTISNTVDNSNTQTNRAKNVLAGTTSEYVSTFRLVATNEAVLVEDFQLNVAGAANFANAVREVVIYNSEGVEVARESVISDTVVEFDNVNLLIPQGTNTYYVKVITNGIGNNFDGEETVDSTFALEITEARGDQSGQDATLPAATSPSLEFRVIPVHISNVAITNTDAVTTPGNGSNIIGNIEITANTWTNTEVFDGSDLDIILDQLAFTVAVGGLTLDDVRVERLDINPSDAICDVVNPAVDPIEVDWSTCDAAVQEIKAGQTARFRVEADLSDVDTNDSVQLRLNNLNDGSTIIYNSTEGMITPVDELRLPYSSVIGIQKVAN